MISCQRNKLWIIGCGNIGRRVARLYQMQGIQARATVQSKESQQHCLLKGIKAILLNLDNDESKLTINSSQSSLFYFTPPTKMGVLDLRLKKFLQYLNTQKPPKRMVLISTTGVYGDCNGRWVDEKEPLKPLADRAKRRHNAEQQLVMWCENNNTEWVILRVPAIYAKDRLPLERLKKGLPLVKIDQSPFTNRIHADDLALICQAAMELSPPNEVYNISDDKPSTMTEYFIAVAAYTGLEEPPQISLEEAKKTMSKGMLSYLKESRKIHNKKMKEKLNIKLIYPTLHDALKK